MMSTNRPSGPAGPLLTLKVHEQLLAAKQSRASVIECSLDLDRSVASVQLRDDRWTWNGSDYPFMKACKERTIYYWDKTAFAPVSRFTNGLIKLVPTEWGPPTFEIDGIKMLPTAALSPYVDAERKVALIKPRDKIILDTCGGLGYFASWCLQGGAAQISSYEKNPDVIWLRSLNPWSPQPNGALTLALADVVEEIATLKDASFDAVLHDPPRFGIAGDLYSQAFYDQLSRVLKRNGVLFHYTGSPNKLTSGRDVPNEVTTRLRRAGFSTKLIGDGIFATNRPRL
jgi:uncharacterized protein